MSHFKVLNNKFIKKIPCCSAIYNDRRQIGLQLVDFEERKQIQLRKQIRKREYEKNIETAVWLG